MNNTKERIKSSISPKIKPKNLRIFEFTKIINPQFVFVGDNVIIDDFCLLYAKADMPIKIGSWVHIATFSSLTGGPVTVGNYCGIAPGSRIIAGSEHYANGALMNPPIPEKFRSVIRKGCKMEDFSFVSTNCCIFPGVTIGEGAVVGAGSVVRSNLEPWGVYIMKRGKMIKIRNRDKNKTYITASKLSKEFEDVRLYK